MQTERNSITYRFASAPDVESLCDLILTHGPNQWNYLPEDSVRKHIASIAEGSTRAVIAESGGKPVGMVTFIDWTPFTAYEPSDSDPKEAAYICEAVVSPDYGGRGIGAELLVQACHCLARSGKRRIYIDRHEENLASAGMMRKAGFLELDTYVDHERRFSGSRRTTVSRKEIGTGARERA